MRLPKPRPWLAASAAAISLAAAPAASAASNPTVDTSYTTRGAWTFVSAPKLHPPKFTTTAGSTSGLAAGDFLLGNFKNITLGTPFTGQSGPLIVNQNLKPVWFKPVAGAYVNNLAAQTFEGKPALSWWQGGISGTGGTTFGEDVVVNQHYVTVATLAAAPGWVLTQHEMLIRGHNAWVTANSAAPVAFGGHTIIDSAVQEYNLLTGKLLYNWTASSHIPLSASHQPAPPFPGAGWDAYHVNSIQLLPGGSAGAFLVSMRNTFSAYKVDIASGKILWTLDGSGAGGNFTLPKNAIFGWQHDVEMHANGLVTLFDDAFGQIQWTNPITFAPWMHNSRGLALRLNTAKGTASFVHQYVVPGQAIHTAFQGNVDLLPNGNVVVGWGSAPFFSEFTSAGKLLTNIMMPMPDVSYRAYVTKWVGLPSIHGMRGVAKTSNGKTTVYASWDGASRLARWIVLAGPNASHVRKVTSAPSRSFETAIKLARSCAVYKVRAVDSQGHILGTSSAFTAHGG